MRGAQKFTPLAMAAVLALAPTGLRAAEPPAPNPQDPVVGALDEGKTYRRVNGHPLTGKDLADFLVERNWEKELPAFVERVLVEEETQRAGVTVSDPEVDAELQRLAKEYARREGQNPELFNMEELARRSRTSLQFLRDQTRTLLGFRKVLIREGRLKPSDAVDGPLAKQVMNARLEAVVKDRHVETDPKKLDAGEAARLGSRSFSRAVLRGFILERLGPLYRGELLEHLKTLTLQYLLAQALKAGGKAELTEEDRHFHYSYFARLLEAEQGVPNGREVLAQQLQQRGVTVKAFLQDPAFTIDAAITSLARARVAEKDLQAEYQARPQDYQRPEKRLAHIFIRVRDTQGRPYNPQWQVEGHARVNELAAQQREERFAQARPRLERLVGLAHGNFAAAAQQASEDDTTKAAGGLIGRVGPHSLLPPPFDQALIQEALKLKPGEVSGPLRSSYGWHLVKCLEQQDTTYEEARERVYLMLLKRKRAEILEQLFGQAKIEDSF